MAFISGLDLANRVAILADGFGVDDERADQPECRRRVLRLAADEPTRKREKKMQGRMFQAPTDDRC